MNKKWQIKDIIDLEYFFHADETQGEEQSENRLIQRDRDIFLHHVRPLFSEQISNQVSENREESRIRPMMIRAWLEQRRNMEKAQLGPEAVLPGDIFSEIYSFLLWLFLIIGLLCGAGAAFSLLTYTGHAPLNVSVFLGWLVFFQIFLILFLILFLSVRAFTQSLGGKSLIFSLVSGLLVRLMRKAGNRAVMKLSGHQRQSMEAAAGLIRGRKKIYGSLFYWPVFIPMQMFGTGFNIGVLGATLLKVLGTDVAFGWQSTVQFSATAVYNMVKILAFPWAWFVPAEIAHPSLSQIEGSHMILKEGIWHLATPDLVSWWPFLCFAVLFYGLMPRLLLLTAGIFARQSGLRRLDFAFSECDRLLRRMKTPLLQTEGSPVSSEIKSGIKQDPEIFPRAEIPPKEAHMESILKVMIPDDIFDECKEDQLRERIRSLTGTDFQEKIRIGESMEKDRDALRKIVQTQSGDVRTDVLILQEAWQPPIKEFLAFIVNLRQNLGDLSRIRVGLIGKPRPDTVFTPVKEEDWNIWQQKLRTLGDPRLYPERLVSDET
ncbi:MAG: DUF2868 domain-containing protein [Desulfococcaceae bacterium]